MSTATDRRTRIDGCVACTRGWRHCHGLWVSHDSGGECTDRPGCDLPPEAHEHVRNCHDLFPQCCG